MSVRAKLNRVPPMLCRLLARKHRGQSPMTNDDIAAESGLARATVSKISHMENWDHVTLHTIERFCTACGVNLLAPSRHITFMRRRGMAYLERGGPTQRRMYYRLLTALKSHAR